MRDSLKYLVRKVNTGEIAVPDADKRADLVQALDQSIQAFDRDGRVSHARATGRAGRITDTEWTFAALLIVEGLRVHDNVRITDLAKLVGTAPPTVTKLIKDMERRGLVTRTADEQDGRASIVGLTAEGRRVAEAIIAARIEALRRVMAEWSEEDLGRFLLLFDRLRADMRRL
jgi:DNA-binding MarR family transcriptional regulator